MHNCEAIPKNWEIATIDNVARINDESLGDSTPFNYSFKYIDISSISDATINWEQVNIQLFRTAPSRARRVVKLGDVLFSTVRPGLQAHSYFDLQKPENYICSTGFAVLRPFNIFPKLLFHIVFSSNFTSKVRKLEVGSNYPAVNESDVRKIQITFPSGLIEQKAIAEILDTIDNAIHATDKLIEKLKSMKKGLLHDLLTRGLDVNGNLRDPIAHPEQFKDSELGRIPKEWEVGKFIDYVEVNPSTLIMNPSPNLMVSFIPMADVSEDGEWINNQKRFYRAVCNGYTLFKEDDVLFAKITPCMENGKGIHALELINQLGFGTTEFHVLRAKCNTSSRFLFHWTQEKVLRGKAESEMIGSAGQQRVQPDFFSRYQVPIIPKLEQVKYAKIMDIQNVRVKAEQVTHDKLILAKKGLMDDLLTGRVRVKV